MTTTWTLQEVVKFLLERFNDNKEIKLSSLKVRSSLYPELETIFLKIHFVNKDILWEIVSITEVNSMEKETDNIRVFACKVFLEDNKYRIYWDC